MLRRALVCLIAAVLLCADARAGLGLFKKKPPPMIDPAKRVPELLGIAKTGTDEDERADAIEELRKFDPQAFPDIVPTLLDVLQNDPKPTVRAEAVSTLAKLRPVSQAVGQALEQTLSRDTSMRVRIQARSALLQYHWAGYRTPKKDAVPPPDGKDPPPPVISTTNPPTPPSAPPSPPVRLEPPTQAVPAPRAVTPQKPSGLQRLLPFGPKPNSRPATRETEEPPLLPPEGDPAPELPPK